METTCFKIGLLDPESCYIWSYYLFIFPFFQFIYLSKMMSNAKNVEIRQYFGIKRSTLSEVLKGVETRIKKDKKPGKRLKC